MLKDYNLFTNSNNGKLNESAPRIPNSEDYWIKKGKIGKVCVIYTHDDLDGIYSAIVMKNYLLEHGFEIEKYGIVNYQESWKAFEIDSKYINIALDYAEDIEGIDVYIDHHGKFQEGENINKASTKTSTGSAYEGICDELGIPVDKMVVDVIDMIDSAKYDFYESDIKKILTFDIKNMKNKLDFAGAFNQLLKRSDHKTFIEVIHNSKDTPSIYNIFRLFKILYPANNLDNYKLKALAKSMGYTYADGTANVQLFLDYIEEDDKKLYHSFQKDFIKDAEYRLSKMAKMTKGYGKKDYIRNQTEFIQKFVKGTSGVKMDGYQILGQMVFIPSGTWSNSLRIRSIIEQDMLTNDRIPTIKYVVSKDSTLYDLLLKSNGQKMELIGDINGTNLDVKENVTDFEDKEGIKGEIQVDGDNVYFNAKQPIFWLMSQFGNTLQIASYHDINKYDMKYLPTLKDGTKVTNLGKYCEDLLSNFVKHFGLDINANPDSTVVAGGHPGIGSISNICSKVKDNVPENMKTFIGSRYLDLIKNKVIQDLSGIPFPNIKMTWGDETEEKTFKPSVSDVNKKLMNVTSIRNAQNVKAQQDIYKK
ncbi:hypothetical protein M0Q50_04055 [bacterium]|jgi:hypothetical protein|nr:hypothetical protein [bacterium]